MKKTAITFFLLIIWPAIGTAQNTATNQTSSSAPLSMTEAQQKALTELKKNAATKYPDYTLAQLPITGTLASYENKVHTIIFNKPGCYKIMAAGESPTSDLNLSLWLDNSQVATDHTSGDFPIISWCVAVPQTTANLQISMYSNTGEYVLATYHRSQSTLPSSRKAGGSENDFIANRIRQLHAMQGGKLKAQTPLFRATLEKNATQTFTLKMHARKCYTLIGTGAPTVRKMKIRLLDKKNQEPLTAFSADSYINKPLRPCPTQSGTYILEISMVNGHGSLGVQFFENQTD